MEIFACVIGRSQRAAWLIKHLSHDTALVDMIYPFWVLRDAGGVTLIDTGFDGEPAAARHVDGFRDPTAVLATLGVLPGDVKRVIVSHLHWDHFCNPGRYPNAEFFVQKADVDYFRGYGKGHAAGSIADDPSLAVLDDLQADGRLAVLEGDTTIGTGVRTVLVGGHTPGIQVTVVERGKTPIVFACDASHLYWNLENRVPTSIINDYTAYVNGFAKIEELRGPDGLWFPGHDPKIVERLTPLADGAFQLT